MTPQRLSFRVPAHLRSRVEHHADRLGLSMSWVAVQLLTHAMEELDRGVIDIDPRRPSVVRAPEEATDGP